MQGNYETNVLVIIWIMKLLKKSIFKIKDDEERHRNSSHMEEFQFQGRSPPYILHITNSTTKKRLKYGP